MKLKLSIAIIALIFLVIVTKSTSKYKGVFWNEKRKLWLAEFYFNGKKSKSYFENELDAANKINQLCESMRIPLKNPELLEMSNESQRKKNLHKKKKKCQDQLRSSEEKLNYGGDLNIQLDALKRWNQLCEEIETPLPNQDTISSLRTLRTQKKQIFEEVGISLRESTISAMPTLQHRKSEKTSQERHLSIKELTGPKKSENGMSSPLQMSFNAEKQHGGEFNDEINAAKKVNELDEEIRMSPQNPKIGPMLTGRDPILLKKRKKTSQYKGVYWHVETGTWYAYVHLNSGKQKFGKYGGMFDDELDAAKKVNYLCEEFEIPVLNPEANRIHNFSFLSLPAINPR